jgi:hypothetical protein
MYKHAVEAFVLVPYAERIAEKVCARSKEFCRSIGATGADKVLDFGEARAILTPTDEGLHFRVEADDSIAFYGIRTLLQGSLSAITTVSDEAMEWLPANRVRSEVPRSRLSNGQNRLGGS